MKQAVRIRRQFQWPDGQCAMLRRARRLEIATLFWMATVIVAMFFAMGSSQAMKTAWIEDILGLVPSIAFLISRHFEKRPPDAAFPLGYYRANVIAYLVAATALMLLGLYLIYDSGRALLSLERPSIGLVEVLGVEFWLGWGMIAALAYSIVPPVILGRMKKPIARKLHDRVLMADAAMQSADWRTAAAAIVGILLVGLGLWWADAVAALIIAVDVVNDGRKHIAQAVADLSDHVPEALEGEGESSTIDRVRQAVEALDWVDRVEVQMRSEGHLVTGTIFVRTRDGNLDAARAEEGCRAAQDAHWRVHEPVLTPMPGSAEDQATASGASSRAAE